MPMSPEQRKAASERMKKQQFERKVKRETESIAEPPESISAEDNIELQLQQNAGLDMSDNDDTEDTADYGSASLEETVKALLNEVASLKDQMAQRSPEGALEETIKRSGVDSNAFVGPNGVQGIQYKYPVEKSYYPDPCERLLNEPSLKRFALRENYFLKWDVTGQIYEKYGITYSEPQFAVDVFRLNYDEDGNLEKQIPWVGRLYMQEDSLAARIAAERLGLTGSFKSNEEMMDEMRYHRIRSWFLDMFKPAKLRHHKKQSLTTVLDGKLVEMYDTEDLINAEDGISKATAIRRETIVE